MNKRLLAILGLGLALAGCGGNETPQERIGAATLTQTGVAWSKLTPVQKKTVVAYCLPPTALDLSPTRVTAAINRLYAGPLSARTRIRAACTRAATKLRAVAQSRDDDAGKRVELASGALLEACPADPQFLRPPTVARRTKKLALAYEGSPDPAKDRRYVGGAIAKLDAGCGPSARLKQALVKTPAEKPTEMAGVAGARTLTGSGPKELGDLAVSKNSDLRWMCGGESGYFSVTSGRGRLSFLSEASRGYRDLPEGLYRDVWVDTAGPWAIVITPKYPSAPRGL